MRRLTVDYELLQTLIDRTVGKVAYTLGAKPPLDASTGTFTESDCSGYIRWLLHRVAGVTIPDGSQVQHAWFESQNFEHAVYTSCQVNDDRLRIAFMPPKGGHGHVWLCLNGETLECCAGHGVYRQPWSVYLRRQNGCYLITDRME